MNYKIFSILIVAFLYTIKIASGQDILEKNIVSELALKVAFEKRELIDEYPNTTLIGSWMGQDIEKCDKVAVTYQTSLAGIGKYNQLSTFRICNGKISYNSLESTSSNVPPAVYQLIPQVANFAQKIGSHQIQEYGFSVMGWREGDEKSCKVVIHIYRDYDFIEQQNVNGCN